MFFLLLFYPFTQSDSPLIGSWQRLPGGQAPQVAFEVMCFDESMRLSVRGQHSYDGTYRVDDDRLELELIVNEVAVPTKLTFRHEGEKLLLKSGGHPEETYLRIDRECPPPLSAPQWHTRSTGHFQVDLPITWSMDSEEPDDVGYQRLMLQSPDGTSTVMLVRIPYAMLEEPNQMEFFVKDLFRELLETVSTVSVTIDEDYEGDLFGRHGIAFHANFDIAGQPVYAHALCPKVTMAYNLVIMTMAAHNESTALRRIVHGAQLH